MARSLFPLINGPRISKCHFEIREAAAGRIGKIDSECRFSIGMNYQQSENVVDLIVSASMDDKRFPFFFYVESQVRLAVKNEISDAEIRRMAILSGAPYTYATLRNFVADLTRGACMTPYYLPVLDVEQAAAMKGSQSKPHAKTAGERSSNGGGEQNPKSLSSS